MYTNFHIVFNGCVLNCVSIYFFYQFIFDFSDWTWEDWCWISDENGSVWEKLPRECETNLWGSREEIQREYKVCAISWTCWLKETRHIGLSTSVKAWKSVSQAIWVCWQVQEELCQKRKQLSVEKEKKKSYL